MNLAKFRQVNDVLAARFGMQTVIIIALAITVLMQQWFINTREEIVIDRPMFQQDRAMKLVRGRATQDVREVWAWNLVTMYGNLNPSTLGHVRGVTYSMLSPSIRAELDKAHEEHVSLMEANQLDIRFQPGGTIKYEPANGWVTIQGIRTIVNLVNPDAKPRKVPYVYQVKIDVEGFRPWVTGWKEGEAK